MKHLPARAWAKAALSLLVLSGCSVYHDARSQLPVDAGDRFAMRLEGARQAARDLDWQLSQDEPQAAQLDSYSWELERRIASIRDVPAPRTPEVNREIAAMESAALLAGAARDAAAIGDARQASALCDRAHASILGVLRGTHMAGEVTERTPVRITAGGRLNSASR